MTYLLKYVLCHICVQSDITVFRFVVHTGDIKVSLMNVSFICMHAYSHEYRVDTRANIMSPVQLQVIIKFV